MGIGIERLGYFRERISQIKEPQLLLSEAERNALKFDTCTALAAVGMAGFLGTIRLLQRQAISPDIANENLLGAAFWVSYALGWNAPYGWLIFDERSAILQEQAKRLKMELPLSLSERALDSVIGIIRRG